MNETILLYIIALLASVCCALSGSLITVQRRAMMGDAISHSALLGLVLAYLISGERSIPYMLLGALSAGLTTSYFTEKTKKLLNIQYDAALGIIFTTSFGTAVILISQYARQVDLDQSCVLFGEIALAPFDTLVWGDTEVGPRAIWNLSIAFVINVLAVTIAWYRIKTTLFSANLAQTVGINSHVWQQLCSSLVAITAVSAFESVGAILVVALLVIPSNISKLLHKKSLLNFILISIFVAFLATFQGIYIADLIDSSIAASIAASLFFDFLFLAYLLQIIENRRIVISR